LIDFRDKDLKSKGSSWVNAQGLSGTSEGTKFICIKPVPQGVSYVAIHLPVYPNSKKPYNTPGKFWYYDFQSDIELIKGF